MTEFECNLATVIQELQEAVNPKCCRVTRSTNQSIQGNTRTPIIFDTVEFDSAGIFDNVSKTKFIIPSDGIYQLVGFCVFLPHSGAKTLSMVLNGSIPLSGIDTVVKSIDVHALNCSAINKFKKGDYIELDGYWAGTGTLDISGGDAWGIPSFAITKISD